MIYIKISFWIYRKVVIVKANNALALLVLNSSIEIKIDFFTKTREINKRPLQKVDNMNLFLK